MSMFEFLRYRNKPKSRKKKHDCLFLCLSLFFIFNTVKADPDISVQDFTFALSAKNIYQDVPLQADFTVSFTNANSSDITETDGFTDNFDVFMLLSNEDLSVSGALTPTTLLTFPTTYRETEANKLTQGLSSGSSETLEVQGMASVLFPSSDCSDVQFLCVYVTKGSNAGFTETESENNYKCEDVATLILCSDDHVDLGVQYMSINGGNMYSDGFSTLNMVLKITLGGTYELKPDQDQLKENYNVKMYLTKDNTIEPELDIEIADLPKSFESVTTEFKTSGTLFLGGSDLKLPELHSSPETVTYCGTSYLGVIVDPGEGYGKVLETNEKNNKKVIEVTVICPNDLWGLKSASFDMGFGQDTLYPSSEYEVKIDAVVQNLQKTNFPGGTSSFQLNLYLHNDENLYKDGTPLQLNKLGSSSYPGNSPISPVNSGQSLSLVGVTFTIADDQYTVADGYTHLILEVVPSGGDLLDEVVRNNFISWPITVATAAASKDLKLTAFTITEDTIATDGSTAATVTVTATIDLDGTDGTTVVAKIFWSKDDKFDASDEDSGMTIDIDSGGTTVTFTSAPINAPTDSSLCGQVFAFLYLDADKAIDESHESNNYLSDTVRLQCDSSDDLSLMSMEILEPKPVFVNGRDVVFAMKAVVACVKSDCSSYTSGSPNFDFSVYADADKIRQDDETALVVDSITAMSGNDGVQSALDTDQATVLVKVKVAVNIDCEKTFRYLGIELTATPTDPFKDNNYLTQKINFDCVSPGSIDFTPASMVTTPSSLDTAAPNDYEIDIDVTFDGSLALGMQSQPHFEVAFFLSDDDVIDPAEDLQIFFPMSYTSLLDMSLEVTSDDTLSLFGLGEYGMVLPLEGTAQFCGQTVYVGIVTDPGNFVGEMDETNNIITFSLTDNNINNLDCTGFTNEARLDVDWKDTSQLPEKIFPNSQIVIEAVVEVTNADTSALEETSDPSDNFNLKVWLSGDDNPGDGDDVELAIDDSAGDYGTKIDAGLEPGSSMSIRIQASLAIGDLDIDKCQTILGATPQLVIETSNILPSTNLAAGNTGSTLVNLVCDFMIKPQIISYKTEPRIWQDQDYTIDFVTSITHLGEDDYALDGQGDNFAIGLYLVNGATEVVFVPTLYNNTVKTRVIPAGETVIMEGIASGQISAADCAALVVGGTKLKFLVVPQNTPQNLGYQASFAEVVVDSDLSFECSDSYVDVEITALNLKDSNNLIVDYMTIDVAQKIEIHIALDFGTIGGINTFDTDPDNNFEYDMYLSREYGKLETNITNTPGHAEMTQNFATDAVMTLTIPDLTVTPDVGGSFCGATYLTIVVLDQANAPVSLSPPYNYAEDIVTDNQVKDPYVFNNYISKKITLRCPGDLFLFEQISYLSTGIAEMESATLKFDATIVNSHEQGYDIPKTAEPHFDFKVYRLPSVEVPVKRIEYSEADWELVTGNFPAGSSMSLTEVSIILKVDTTLCGDFNSGDFFIKIVPGGGLMPGFYDQFPDNDDQEDGSITCSGETEKNNKLLSIDVFADVTVTSSPPNIEIGNIPANIKVWPHTGTPSDAPNPTLSLYISQDSELDGGDTSISSYNVDSDAGVLLESPDVVKKTLGLSVSLTASDYEDDWCGKHVYIIIEYEDDFEAVWVPAKECPDNIYSAGFNSIMVPDTLFPDFLTRISFSSKVTYLSTSDTVSGAATGQKNIDFKLYAQKGTTFDESKTMDITPEFRYSKDIDLGKYEDYQLAEGSAPNDPSLEFSKVEAEFYLPTKVCAGEMDHLVLFLKVEDAYLTDGTKVYDHFIGDNIKVFPIQCATGDTIDLRVQSRGPGQSLFTLDRIDTVTFDAPNTFYLTVTVELEGTGYGWEEQPMNASEVFEYQLVLKNPELSLEKKITIEMNTAEINKETMTTRDMQLGGEFTLSPDDFLGFCGGDNELVVMLDPMNKIAEGDEVTNNEAVIYGVTVEGTTCDNGIDIVAGAISIDLGNLNNVINSDQSVDYKCDFDIIKGDPATADPSYLSYDVILSFDKDLNNPTNKNILGGTQTHDVNADGYTVTFSNTISLSITADPQNKDNQLFCGMVPYLGIHINSDDSVSEVDMTNNWSWKKVHFICESITGFALPLFLPTSTNQGAGDVLKSGSNQLVFTASVLNSGVLIPEPTNGENLFLFKLYIGESPFAADGEELTVTTWQNDFPRNKEMLKGSSQILSGVIATFEISETQCALSRFICLKVERDNGIYASWIDENIDNDEYCHDLIYGDNVRVDCERDIAMSFFEFDVLSAASLFQDTDLMLEIDADFTMTGKLFDRTDRPYFKFELYLSDWNNPSPTVTFNSGNPYFMTDVIEWDLMSSEILNGNARSAGATNAMHGYAHVRIPASLCATNNRFACLKYVPIPDWYPTILDGDTSNDFICIDITSMLSCTDNTIDLRPGSFEAGPAIFRAGEPKPFNLLVEVDVSGPGATGQVVFDGDLFLSVDQELDQTDVEIPYELFHYGRAKAEMSRYMEVGVKLVNIGDMGIEIPINLDSLNISLCGSVYLIAVIDSGNAVEETNEYNNMGAFPLTTSCIGDSLLLIDVDIKQTMRLYAKETSVISLDVTLQNLLTQKVKEPSPGKPTYFIEVIAMPDGVTICDSHRTVYPDNYHRPITPLEILDLKDVQVTISSTAFTKALCESTTHLKVVLTPGVTSSDVILENNYKEIPLLPFQKRCGSTNGNRQLALEMFSMPDLITVPEVMPVSIMVSAALGSSAEEILINQLTVSLYISKDPIFDAGDVLMKQVSNNVAISDEGLTYVDMSTDLGFDDQLDPLFCGSSYLFAVLDEDNLISEPVEELWHTRMERATVFCKDDFWSLCNFKFTTSGGELVENMTSSFEITAIVTCVQTECYVNKTAANIRFSLLSSMGENDDIIDDLADVSSSWTSTPGHTISPSLGESFLYPGMSLQYTITGSLDISPNRCSPSGFNTISLLVDFGANLLGSTDEIMENNIAMLEYPCLKGQERDIIITEFSLLVGDTVQKGHQAQFSLTLELEGTPIPPMDTGPTAVPLDLGFYLSMDDKLSPDDINLNYEMTECLSDFLKAGLQPGVPLELTEFAGLPLPPNLCGTYYVIAKADESDKYLETSEANNVAVRKINFRCENDLYAVLDAKISNSVFWKDQQTNITVSMTIENRYPGDIPPCFPPCQAVQMYVAVSEEDTIPNPGAQYALPWIHEENRLNDGLKAGQTKHLEDIPLTINLNDITCGSSVYLITGILPQDGPPIVEKVVSNNYKATPIFKKCDGKTDISVDSFVVPNALTLSRGDSNEGFQLSVTLDVAAGDHIDPFKYRLWLSRNTILEMDRDFMLDIHVDTSSMITEAQTASVPSQNFDGEFNIPADLRPDLCGVVFLLLELDSEDVVVEENEDNNIYELELNIECPNDIFSLSQLRVSSAPEEVWQEQTAIFDMTMVIHCHDICPGPPSHPLSAFPVHFGLKLKVFDDHFQELGELTPSLLDAFWISEIAVDSDPDTILEPTNILQTNFVSEPSKTLHFADHFSFDDVSVCDRVMYIGVELQKGDSMEVSSLDWTIQAENDIAYAPYRFKCSLAPVDLNVASFTVNGVDSLTLDVSSDVSISYDLTVGSLTDNWPETMSGEEMFKFTFLVGDPGNEVNLGYQPSVDIATLLQTAPPSGSSLTLSTPSVTLEKSLMSNYCGVPGVTLSVVIDHQNTVPELNELNNRADIPLTITGCSDGFYLDVIEAKTPAWTRSGLVVDVGLEWIEKIVGSGQIPSNGERLYNIQAGLLRDRFDLEGIPLTINCSLDDSLFTGPITGGGSTGETTTIHKSGEIKVMIPENPIYCDESWLLEVSLIWNIDNGATLENSRILKHLRIVCPGDILGLVDVQLSSTPSLWRPLLNLENSLTVTVTSLRQDTEYNPSGLYKVREYFSTDDKLDDSDFGLDAKVDGSVFHEKGPLAAGTYKTSPLLSGSVRIPDTDTCLAAKEDSATPTWIIEIVPTDPSLSMYTGNDIIKIPIDKTSIDCGEDLLDLYVTDFYFIDESGTAIEKIAPNTDYLYRLTGQYQKTGNGSIPEASSADTQDVSMTIDIYMSLDEVASFDDVKIPIEYNTAQMSLLRRGVTPLMPNVLPLSVGGEGLKVDVFNNPDWKYFCGLVYILVKLQDVKNNPSIDPNSDNNWFSIRVTLECQNDLIALETFHVKPLPPQNFLYSGVDIVVDFYAKIWNYGIDDLTATEDGRSNIYLNAYMSPDRALNLHVDSEINLLEINEESLSKTNMNFPLGDSLVLEGPFKIHIPFSACTSPYMLFVISLGVHVQVKDHVIENNMRYLDIKDVLRCDALSVDFEILQFSLPNGLSLLPGDILPYELETRINIRGEASVGFVDQPVFSFQFYLSEDTIFDDSDFSVLFDTSEHNNVLFGVFTTTTTISLNSITKEIVTPKDMPSKYCGNHYLLAVLDNSNKVDELTEYNNIHVLEIFIRCTNDIFQLSQAEVKSADVLYKSPAPLSMDLDVTNVYGQLIPQDGTHKIFDIQVYVQNPDSTVEHFATPSTWDISSGQSTFMGEDFQAGSRKEFRGIYGEIDISEACSALAGNLETGAAILSVVISKGNNTNLENIKECVTENNIYKTEIQVDCGEDFIDLRESTTVDFEIPSTLQFGLNPFTFNVFAEVSGSSGWPSGEVDPMFDYEIALHAGGITRVVEYDASFKIAVINEDTTTDREIDLSDEIGVNLDTDNFLFLCNYDGSITFTIQVDKQNSISESNEENNEVSLSNLAFDVSGCTDNLDIVAEKMMINNLEDDTIFPDSPVDFSFDFSVTATGSTELPGSDTKYTWSWVLSHDDVYDLGDALLPADIDATQMATLQSTISQSTTTVFTISGSNLAIPLDTTTQKYCFTHTYIGFLIDNDNLQTETNENDNVALYQVIFDCGDSVDECSLEIDDCSDYATCTDQVYNITSYIGTPFYCTCQEGFVGDGRTCSDEDECVTDPTLCHGIANSECQNLEGGYECACNEGFLKAYNSAGIQICDNINECENSTLFSCHSLAECIDDPGTYHCSCVPGTSGDGVDSCIDIIDCNEDTCNGQGVCNEEINGFTCDCEEHYSGVQCDVINGNWEVWSEWSTCMAHCGPGVMARERTCSNPPPSNGGAMCERDAGNVMEREFQECEIRSCDEGHIAWCTLDPCFTDQGGICLYKEKGKSYTCECAIGYKRIELSDGRFVRCQDINECTETSLTGALIATCHADAVCENIPSDYKCTCKDGFLGDGWSCADIDECAGPSPCGSNMQCTNTHGSYECTCFEGYRDVYESGKLVRCLETRKFPYGQSVGDTLVTAVYESTGERASSLIIVPHGLPVFHRTIYNSLYVSENGVIVITNTRIENDRKETFRYPHPLSGELLDQSFPPAKGILCPFWSDTKSLITFHKVWTHAYTDMGHEIFTKIKELLMEGEGVDIEPRFILKATWENMAPEYDSSSTERNTFQAFVVTDYVHTYAIYIYEDEAMKWEPLGYNSDYLQTRYRGYPGRIGYVVKTNTSEIFSHEDENSGKWSIYSENPNAYRVSEKVMQPHGKEGYLFYRVDDNVDMGVNPRRNCELWYENEPEVSTWEKDLLGACPPTESHALLDKRYIKEQTAHCFKRSVPNKFGGSVNCCYRDGYFINSGLPDDDYEHSSVLSRFHSDWENATEHVALDVDPFHWCCLEAEGRDYCHLYMSKRPLANTTLYDPPKQAQALGAIQFKTFDGLDYIYSGYGEFVLLRSKPGSFIDAMMQIRTVELPELSNNEKATIIVAVAGQIDGSPKVQVYLRDDGTLDVFVDNSPYNSEDVLPGVVVLVKESMVTFVFESGIAITTENMGQRLFATVQIPVSLELGIFEGLLGNFDGDKSNDLTTASGPSFNPDASSSEQYFEFGETWSLRNLFGVSNADFHTLFSQYTDPSSANAYFKVGFVPSFFDENINSAYSPEELAFCTLDGESFPNSACLYDLTVTGSEELASTTLDKTQEFLQNNENLGNLAPVYLSSTIKHYERKVGVAETFEIHVEDFDGDALNISIGIKDINTGQLNHMYLNAVQSLTNPKEYSVSYEWLPENKEVEIEFYAKDTRGHTSVLLLDIVMCSCQNEGWCQYDIIMRKIGNFAWAGCRCPPGWTGDFCDEDLDGCALNPCYTECTDRSGADISYTGDDREFTCTPCPDSMNGDGQVCTDVNECVLPSIDSRKHRCEQRCVNLPDTYRCECRDGWRLDADGKTCADIPECASPFLNDCDPVYGYCEDSPEGTFTCTCTTGYQLMEDHSCQDIDECLTSNGGCDHVCVNTLGSYKCLCDVGFQKDPTSFHQCVAVDLCEKEPVCEQKCINMENYYECECNGAFDLQSDDRTCQPKIELQCRFTTCDSRRGKCAIVGGVEECFCPLGYTVSISDGKTCLDINECTTGTALCDTNSRCVNTRPGYVCRCFSGYQLKPASQTECENINECSFNQTVHGCDQFCIDLLGTYKCTCAPGFYLDADGRTCHDINECTPGVANECAPESNCTNTIGGYLCTCMEGFTGDGYTCTELDECLYDNGGCEGGCVNLYGGYECTCIEGFMVDPFTKVKCIEIDECLFTNPVCDHTCTNTIGSYYCSCLDGFTLEQDGSCSATSNCSTCRGGTCFLLNGLHECFCPSGYEPNEFRNCFNINECLVTHVQQVVTVATVTANLSSSSNSTTAETETINVPVYSHHCVMESGATCYDTVGGYDCICPDGYKVALDTRTCTDLDECFLTDENQKPLCDPVSTRCVNSEGSYTCVCQDGFREYNSSHCLDYNECRDERLDVAPCSKRATCVNLPGKFKCDCMEGFTGDGIICTDVNECLDMTKNTCTVNQTCVNIDASFYCECKQGFKIDSVTGKCIDINECESPLLNGCEFSCENTLGSFKCICPDGYQLDSSTGRKCILASQCTNPAIISSCWQDCVRVNFRDQCSCRKGYVVDGVQCLDIDECNTGIKKYKHHCGIHSECNNTIGGYTCICDRYYEPDPDGLACTETFGNWGTWSAWAVCSKECHGRKHSTRECAQPPPSPGKMCPGDSLRYVACNFYGDRCKALEIEIREGVFIDYPGLKVTEWEDVEVPILEAVCLALNQYCTKDNVNFQECCGKPVPITGMPSYRFEPFCVEEDIKLGRGYPRHLSTGGTRIMIHVEILRNNPMCGGLTDPPSPTPVDDVTDGASRRKRATHDYQVPNELIIEALKKNNTIQVINEAVAEGSHPDYISKIYYTSSPAYNEDLAPSTTIAPIQEVDDSTPLYIIILALIFTVIGSILTVGAVYILMRNPSLTLKKKPKDVETVPLEQMPSRMTSPIAYPNGEHYHEPEPMPSTSDHSESQPLSWNNQQDNIEMNLPGTPVIQNDVIGDNRPKSASPLVTPMVEDNAIPHVTPSPVQDETFDYKPVSQLAFSNDQDEPPVSPLPAPTAQEGVVPEDDADSLAQDGVVPEDDVKSPADEETKDIDNENDNENNEDKNDEVLNTSDEGLHQDQEENIESVGNGNNGNPDPENEKDNDDDVLNTSDEGLHQEQDEHIESVGKEEKANPDGESDHDTSLPLKVENMNL